MRNISFVICSFFCASAVFADGLTVSARVASARMRAPTFKELHEQYMRISLNESGWRSYGDQVGILESMLYGSGGREHGINRARLMLRFVQHSPRTFPRNSRFLAMLTPEKSMRSNKLRTRHNIWTSTVKLDCTQPDGWDDDKSGPWAGYVKRCAGLRESTRAFLRGSAHLICKGKPTTWGSEEDARRKGGPIDCGWQEISCDQDSGKIEVAGKVLSGCQELREKALVSSEARRILSNGIGCTSNRFWNWTIVTRDRRMAMR